MDASLTAESQLMHDIEALRQQYPNTQELYREVCTTMFFRYGITPTANRLYQLVRKGSMSAPAEALSRFWAQLRERSRVTIDGAGIPEPLRTGAGELLAALWKQAQEAANAALAAVREEAEERMAAAARAEAAAEARSAALAAELVAEREACAAGRAEAAALRHQLAAAEALNGKLRERIDEGRRELNEQHAWFKTVERDHAAALDKLRVELQAERRAGETTRHQALQDVERERAGVDRLQCALDSERAAAAAAVERHRTELREALSQLGALHERVGALEGSNAAIAAARDRAFGELAAARGELSAAQADAAAAAGRAAALETALRHAADRAAHGGPRKRAQAD